MRFVVVMVLSSEGEERGASKTNGNTSIREGSLRDAKGLLAAVAVLRDSSRAFADRKKLTLAFSHFSLLCSLPF